MTEDVTYNIKHVATDTEAILTPSAPIPVRMETLRRASLYASHDRVVARQLLSMLMTRADAAERTGHSDGTALFDAGYVIEAFDEIQALAGYETQFAAQARELAAVTRSHDPQLFLYRSQALRPDDASIDFALALMMRPSAKREEHVRKAQAGSKRDQLLASNVARLRLQ